MQSKPASGLSQLRQRQFRLRRLLIRQTLSHSKLRLKLLGPQLKTRTGIIWTPVTKSRYWFPSARSLPSQFADAPWHSARWVMHPNYMEKVIAGLRESLTLPWKLLGCSADA